MPGKTIGKSLGLGYLGSFSRMGDCVISNRVAKEKIAFGDPVVLNPDNTFSRFGTGKKTEDFVGIAVREVKQQTDMYETCGAYLAGEPTDVLFQGTIIVHVKKGNPTAGGKVFIRTVKNVAFPDCEIGSFEAEADGTNTVELKNAKFTTGQRDAEGLAEVTILTRQA